MVFTEACMSPAIMLLPSSIAIYAYQCGFFSDVKRVLSLLKEIV